MIAALAPRSRDPKLASPARLIARVALAVGTLGALASSAAFAQGNVGARPPVLLNNPSFLDLAFSTKSVELGYRQLTSREDGYFGLNVLANEDSDLVVSARLLRVGALVGVPTRLGVGVAAFGAALDEPEDDGDSMDAYALALVGMAEYDLNTPTRSMLSAELSLAPDIATFGDADNLIDFKLRVSVEISRAATAFCGYHVLEVDLDPDYSIDKRFHIGVSLGL